MKFRLPANKQLIFYLVYLLLVGAVFARMIQHYDGSRYQWQVIALLSVYLVLLLIEYRISRIFPKFIYIYFASALGITIWLVTIPSITAPLDYYTNLVIPLAGQAIWELPFRPGRICVAIFSVFCIVINVITYGFATGIGFGLTYVAASLMIAILGSYTQKADFAQMKSQMLLSELQSANRKLQVYAEQVETLAITEERNRLARELHDSVSQTIFSMTLTAQSARILLEKDPGRVANLLDHLQSLSQNALAEMRTLIQEFREHSIVENGFFSALRNHAALRKAQDNLSIDFNLDESILLSSGTSETLFRIAQEALNNIVKHAKTDNAIIELFRQDEFAVLSITDHGQGFAMNENHDRIGHVGLSSMEERAKELGANLIVQSAPGQGTIVKVENIPVIKAGEPTLENDGTLVMEGVDGT
ncbi:MAG: sensor histidine kinase [Anaerolineaceae bacterium]